MFKLIIGNNIGQLFQTSNIEYLHLFEPHTKHLKRLVFKNNYCIELWGVLCIKFSL